MDKQKYFGVVTDKDVGSDGPQLTDENTNPIMHKIEKYKDFFMILKDDLRKNMDKNIQITKEISEIEEERQYYLDKINNVLVI